MDRPKLSPAVGSFVILYFSLRRMEKNMNKLIGISIVAAIAAVGAAAVTLYVLKKRKEDELCDYDFDDDDDLFDDCECGDCFIDGDDVIEKAEETFGDDAVDISDDKAAE